MVLGRLDIHMLKKEVGPVSLPHREISSKQIEDLNGRPLLTRRKHEIKLHDIDVGKDFLDEISKGNKSQIWQVELDQIKNYYFQKGSKEHTEKPKYAGRKIFVNYASDKLFFSNMYKESKWFNNQKWMKKWKQNQSDIKMGRKSSGTVQHTDS